MRVSLLVCLAAVALSACGGDTFNTDNTGNAVCPGYLFFNSVSRGMAVCTSAPQQCVDSRTNTRITCACEGTTGQAGTWTCREMR